MNAETAGTAPTLAGEEALAFLQGHAPFADMQEQTVRALVPKLRLASFAREATIVSPASGPVAQLYIVQRGLVGSRPEGVQAEPDRTLGPGELFPVGALSAGGSTTRVFHALHDTVCLLVARDDFLALREASPEFERYCTQAITETLRQSLESLYGQYRLRANEQQSLTRTLAELVRKPPVTCVASATLRDAAQRMADAKVRTIVVLDESGAAVGMFTLWDLLRRVVLPERSLTAPLSEVMTAPIVTLPGSATAHEAMYVMADRGIRQLAVVDDRRVVGVINERDLFALQRISLRQVTEGLHTARTLEELQRAAADIRGLTQSLLAQGVAAEPLTRTIAALNDGLSRRVLAFALDQGGVNDLRWCWLALGSEGRGEQTLATDQDNALVFEAADGAEAQGRRDLLARWAAGVNETLDVLGFPLCAGKVMASNADYCLSTEEWKARFLRWIREPTPEALLAANIVFDFRALYGDAALAQSLRSWLFGYTMANPTFLRLMVQNALAVEPPLGLIRTFAVDGEPDAKGTIDLKTRGTRLFVDCARVLALAYGIPDTGTAARLRAGFERLHVEPRDTDAALDAFHFLQLLRLRQQELGRGDPNRIDPYALNDLEQRLLKEALRQARQVQERLRIAYRL